MKKRGYKDSRLDWFIVSYSTIMAWIVVGVILIGGGAYFYYYYIRNPSPDKEAARAIAKAESMISEIRSRQPNIGPSIDRPINALQQARNYNEQGDYANATSLAEESQRYSQEILDSIKQESEGEHKAYLTAIEGRIEVKRKGAVDWIEGREGMPLGAGDLVKTGGNSNSHIMFFDHSSYILKSNTLISIQESYEDPFSRARKVSVKLDSGAVDLTTGKKNVPGSSSTIASPTAQAVMGEESSAALSFNDNSGDTSFALYKGTADINAGDKKIPVTTLEKVNIDRNENVTSKTKIPETTILLQPANERQFLFENPEQSEINFQWQAIRGAQSYNIEISETTLFARPLLVKRGIRANKLTLSDFGEGIYYWRVSSYAPGRGESKVSDFYKFRIRKIVKKLASEDTIPPKLEVDELKVLGNIVLIFGRTEPDVLLTINNKRVDVDNDGSFKDVIELHRLGRNKLLLVAQDPSGNRQAVEREVYIEEY